MEKKITKAIILAGGFGSRLENITKTIPKPLVKIFKKPIIIYIIEIYLKFGIKKFYIATGYKGDQFKKFFLKKNYKIINKNKKHLCFEVRIKNILCEINLINTGLKTMTGGRLLEVSKYFKDENFLLTYGDGISDININNVIKLHFKLKNLVTMTVVNPPARFGVVKIKGNKAISFTEKLKINNAWINGGFFALNKKFIKLIKNKKTILEQKPLEIAAKKNQLGIYKHKGMWQCMDTKRDIEIIKKIISRKDF